MKATYADCTCAECRAGEHHWMECRNAPDTAACKRTPPQGCACAGDPCCPGDPSFWDEGDD